MYNNELAPKVSKSRDMGAHTECMALNHDAQKSCGDYVKAAHREECMYCRFGYMCDYNNFKPINAMVGGATAENERA